MEKTFIDKLAWIYIKDRKILSTRSKGKDTWYIPGGKRETGESDHEALIREVNEELSVNLIPETIEHVGTFEAQAHGKPEGTVVRMTCYESKFEGELKPSAEIEEIAWFTHADKERSSPVDKIIFDDLKEKNLID
jgi:ADP-ribose pyrophosphatase YjhB (NUDIX family)